MNWIKSKFKRKSSNQTVVIDCGSESCKVGSISESTPHTIPSYVRNKTDNQAPTFPIQRGIIEDWNAMENMLYSIFQDPLGITSSSSSNKNKTNTQNNDDSSSTYFDSKKDNIPPVVLTANPFRPVSERHQLAELMFEKFQVPALYLGISGVLSLFAAQATTGIALDLGASITHAMPIVDGYAVKNGAKLGDYGGADLTQFFYDLILRSNQSPNLELSRDWSLLQRMKSELCYLPFANPDQPPEPRSYRLPDGSEIEVGEPSLKCPKALFAPSVLPAVRKDTMGIQDMIFSAAKECDTSHQQELLQNVYLSGGTSLVQGLPESIEKECEGFDLDFQVNVNAIPHREYAAWTGGKVLASLSSFRQMMMTSQEYQENGAKLITDKCF
eukprot:gb/GECH01002218.1/.p1 GENE.gb/GECH01002218.1/~~gb/GECH01002218.1/.p1  ORF type:complete len:385 (+),score=85.40 gb/GECH01002218.1/:1-1155(+)